MLRWIERLLALIGLLFVLFTALLLVTFETIPTHNTRQSHFDVILVLGCPASLSGQPAPEQRSRVTEAVKEFKAGRAQHLIFSGGPTENQFTEGQVMATLAQQQGVPASAITVEGQAHNTIQNIYYSNRILKQNGWTSVEVVSSPSHLPRAALILRQYSFQWSEHAAPWPPEYDWQRRFQIYAAEIVLTFELRWRGFPPSPYLPTLHAA